jgi:hypothetical protein
MVERRQKWSKAHARLTAKSMALSLLESQLQSAVKGLAARGKDTREIATKVSNQVDNLYARELHAIEKGTATSRCLSEELQAALHDFVFAIDKNCGMGKTSSLHETVTLLAMQDVSPIRLHLAEKDYADDDDATAKPFNEGDYAVIVDALNKVAVCLATMLPHDSPKGVAFTFPVHDGDMQGNNCNVHHYALAAMLSHTSVINNTCTIDWDQESCLILCCISCYPAPPVTTHVYIVGGACQTTHNQHPTDMGIA